MVKESIDQCSCQQRSIAGCAKEAVKGIRVSGEREKVRSILNIFESRAGLSISSLPFLLFKDTFIG